MATIGLILAAAIAGVYYGRRLGHRDFQWTQDAVPCDVLRKAINETMISGKNKNADAWNGALLSIYNRLGLRATERR